MKNAFWRNVLYPRGIKCIVCDEELCENTRYELCPACKLPYNDNYCSVCGRAVLAQNAVCDECKNAVYAFTAARSSFLYSDNAATLVHRLKFRDAKYLAEPMAEFMTDTYYKTQWNAHVVTFVPLHKSRRRMRGYNQSALLAKSFAERAGLPCVNALVKTLKTKNMVGLTRKERQENVRGSFSVSDASLVSGKSVLLIDDVFTTGSTASECASVLKSAGAQDVYVLTFASVPQKIQLV